MKISIVTPSLNNGEHIEQSLMMVMKQRGDFDIEHIVMDGGSTDGTIKILEKHVKKYGKQPSYTFKYFSEKDNGMYDAILSGFEHTTGDIMAWINTDDMYQEGAFQTITDVFNRNQDIKWLKGITDYIALDGSIIRKGRKKSYARALIMKGIYGPVGPFIQQDSVFWRRELWSSVDHDEIGKYKMAGDFRLWQLFAQQTDLYTINSHLSYFRKRPNQKSGDFKTYLSECMQTVKYNAWEEFLYKSIFKIEKFSKVDIIKGPEIKI